MSRASNPTDQDILRRLASLEQKVADMAMRQAVADQVAKEHHRRLAATDNLVKAIGGAVVLGFLKMLVEMVFRGGVPPPP